ncbi:MAG TPA: LysR family transcriptional regulator [Polyangiaceae bacterium]|nr:LysR family transcriptional regulator [Polyangiaceae bacterium]
MTEPLETAELLAFSKAVDAKSLSRAASELGVPRATLSRRLARLEKRLGTRLLRRSTRSLLLTDSGEALYRHARIVLDALATAEASVRQTDQAVRGDLRVSVPPMANESLQRLFCDFAERYPEVKLQVHATTRIVDLQRDGYDVALRASVELQPGLIARTLVRDPVLAVASPAYLAQHGTPRARRDLRGHRCLMGFARGELPQSHWPLAGGGQLHVEGHLFSNDVQLLCAAALRGVGIAFLPLLIAHPHLESGALVPVLQGVLAAESQIAVVYPEREFVPPQVRAFVDAVVEWGPAALGRSVPARCVEAARQLGAAKARKRARRKR